MRCSSCGTENAPDSRFCGGCGAKLTAPENRVAPTHKMLNDARFDAIPGAAGPISTPPGAYVAPPIARGPTSAPPGAYSQAPPVMPETIRTPPPSSGRHVVDGSAAPFGGAAGRGSSAVDGQGSSDAGARRGSLDRASTDPVRPTPVPGPASVPIPRPAGSQPPAPQLSSSMPAVPRLRWGLIAIVLVIDLGLAGAGAVMLSEGLRHDEIRVPAEGSAGSAGSAAPVAPPAVKPPPGGANGEGGGSTTKAHAAARVAPVGDTTRVTPDAGGASPAVDPIKAQVVAAVDQAQAHLQQSLDTCYATASKALPADQALHGTVTLQFQVLADGHITGAAAVDNDTGSMQLGTCLASEIGKWVLPPHPGDPVQIVRPITFNPQATP